MSILDFLDSALEANGLRKDQFKRPDDAYYELLTSRPILYEQTDGTHRWWIDILKVTNIGGRLIGFYDAQTTGDNSPHEAGWEFEASSICEVEAYEVTKTHYRPIC